MSTPFPTPPDDAGARDDAAVTRELPARDAAPWLRRPWLRPALRAGLPIVVLLLSLGIRQLLFATAPTAETAEPVPLLPAVRVSVATPQDVVLEVVAYGTVTPRTESDLVAEVRGRVVWVAPSLVAGGFFSEGDELLRLDGREPKLALDRAKANVALRSSEAKLSAAEAERRRTLARRDAASAADLEQFESRADVARAALDEARAQLAQAELDLERTVLRAPFDGRVRERHVDIGQFVNPGAVLARLYATDYAEVRLPIQTSDLAFLDLPSEGTPPSPVTLDATLGGRHSEWPAELTRSEGSIDLRTRMLHVVARVDDPQGLRTQREPLLAGLFVRGVIRGRELKNVYRFPVLALREDDRVFIVDEEDRLRPREVEVARRSRDEVIIRSGLTPGDRVVVSPLRAITDGMRVRVADDPGSSAAPDASAAR